MVQYQNASTNDATMTSQPAQERYSINSCSDSNPQRPSEGTADGATQLVGVASLHQKKETIDHQKKETIDGFN